MQKAVFLLRKECTENPLFFMGRYTTTVYETSLIVLGEVGSLPLRCPFFASSGGLGCPGREAVQKHPTAFFCSRSAEREGGRGFIEPLFQHRRQSMCGTQCWRNGEKQLKLMRKSYPAHLILFPRIEPRKENGRRKTI